MPRLWFHPPVSVESGRPGMIIAVNSVERAAELLLTWDKRGPSWEVAVRACMDAMAGTGTAAAVREAFASAAKAAGTWIEG